jgi:hypothetical protein
MLLKKMIFFITRFFVIVSIKYEGKWYLITL